jgi:archaellum biogenesis ATPase FlaH
MNEEQFFELLKSRGKISYFELYNEFFNGNEEEFKNLLKTIAGLVDKGKVIIFEVANDVVLVPREKEVQGNLKMFANKVAGV